jgi:nucleoside 2-deoxyribosyltransferase
MPFSEKTADHPTGFFDEVLRNLIMPAAVDAGFKVETAKREGSDVIQSTIVNDLLNADLVVADLSDHNPNVLFELGLRMAFDKPIALIRAKGTAPIFDVDNMLRVFEYDSNLWKSTVETDVPKLSAHIKGTWDTRETAVTYMKLLKKA